MKAKSFIEILEQQIRSDLREEIEAEVRAEMGAQAPRDPGPPQARVQATHAGERLETWLTSRLEKFSFGTRRPSAYQVPPRPRVTTASEPCRPEPKFAPELRFEARSFEQLCARELLGRHAGLPESFSEKELKTAWRRAAMKTHPDRHLESDGATRAQATVLFRELQSAHEILLALVEESASAKAAA